MPPRNRIPRMIDRVCGCSPATLFLSRFHRVPSRLVPCRLVSSRLVFPSRRPPRNKRSPEGKTDGSWGGREKLWNFWRGDGRKENALQTRHQTVVFIPIPPPTPSGSVFPPARTIQMYIYHTLLFAYYACVHSARAIRTNPAAFYRLKKRQKKFFFK